MDHKTLRILEYDKIIKNLRKKAFSSLGEKLIDELLPVSDSETITLFMQQTSEAVRYIQKYGLPPLDGIKDIRESVNRAAMGAMLRPDELLAIASTMRAGRLFKEYAAQGDYGIIKSLSERLHIMKSIEEEIFRCIISDDEIADDATPSLKNIRRHIMEANQKVKELLESIVRSPHYQKMLQEPIITVRNGRYVVPVRQEFRNSFPGLIHDQSGSGATLFIEPMSVVEANNDLKTLLLKEADEIERLLKLLASMVAERADDILNDLDILAQMDFMFAKGQLSIEMDGVQPILVSKGAISLKKARHPLIDPSHVVPIDIEVGGDFSQLIITGPNTGGKTVTLKTIGLFTAMVQSGLHIPVQEGSQMAVFENIYADIGDEQSIEQNLSTFSSHMVNIISILDKANDRSLVLLDELGAGTDPTEGAALAMAILDELRDKKAVVVATTHYSQLKAYALQTPGVINGAMEFDVNTLRPTYRLIIGIPGKSNAFVISRKLGLSENVLRRAEAFLKESDLRFEDVIGQLEQQRLMAEKQYIESQQVLEQAHRLKQQYEELNEELERKKNDIIRKAKQEAKNIVSHAKNEAEAIIKELRMAQIQAQTLGQANQAIKIAREKLKENIAQLELTDDEPAFRYIPIGEIKPGKEVYVIPLKARGFVNGGPDDEGNVQVQVGVLKVMVALKDLAEIDEEKTHTKTIAASTVPARVDKEVSMTIDVRGQMLQEALANIDKYLDDAAISGLQEVLIIHGKGTGTLRAGIHNFLRHHPHVVSYRLGRYGEGETGVTVVKLQ